MLTRNSAPVRKLEAEPPPLPWNTLERQHASLSRGRVAYLRHGSGTPLLLVHGIPTSCRLWEPLMGVLGQRYDCIAPDLLGLGRSLPANRDVDLASPGQADMLAELLDHLGIDRCFAVFHDQGGAHGIQMLKRHGDRIDAVLFTNCVCYDNWPVPLIDSTALLARMGLVPLLARLRLLQAVLGLAMPLTVTRGRIPKVLRDDWFHAANNGGEALTAWCDYVVSQSPDHTRNEAETLRAWQKPAEVLWAADDRFLPDSWALRLGQDLCGPDYRPRLLPFAGHFWQTELPESGAGAIQAFFDTVEAQRSGS